MLLYTTATKSTKGTNLIISTFLKFIAFHFNNRKSLNRYLKVKDGYLNFSIGLRTEDNTVCHGISFLNGKVTVTKTIAPDAKAVLIFKDDIAARRLLLGTPTDVIYMLLKSDVRIEGSISYANNLFIFHLAFIQWRSEARDENRTSKR
jgi:formate C-acetyltransferase